MTNSGSEGSLDGGVSDVKLASSSEFIAYCGKTSILRLPADYEENNFDVGFVFQILHRLSRSNFTSAGGRRLKLHVGIPDDPEPNAFADVRQGEHFLGVNTGVHLSAGYLARHAIARRDAVPGIGKLPARQVDGDILLNPGMREWTDIANSEPIDWDPRRGQIAVFIRLCALWFAMYHEWTHVSRGHCDFLGFSGQPAKLSECGTKIAHAPVGMGALSVRRTFEYLADAEALESTLQMVVDGSDPVSKGGGWLLSPVERRRLLLVACGVMAAIWHQAASSRKFLDDHPRPSTRFLGIIQAYRRQAAEMDILEPLEDVGAAIGDLARIGRHCSQLGPVVEEMIAITRTRRPWSEHEDVLACPKNLGDMLDMLAYRPA